MKLGNNFWTLGMSLCHFSSFLPPHDTGSYLASFRRYWVNDEIKSRLIPGGLLNYAREFGHVLTDISSLLDFSFVCQGWR